MANLGFDIFARDRNASRNIDKVGQAADRTGRKFGVLSARTKHMSAGMRVGFSGVASAMGAIASISVFKKFFDEASEARRVGRLTEAVIKSTGGAAHVTSKHVAKLAEAIGNQSAVEDELIQSTQNLLLTFTGIRNEAGKNNRIFDRASQAVVDMTAAMYRGTVTQQGMKASAIQVGKALNDPIKGITALTRVGVNFTERQKEQIRLLVESGDKLGAQKIILRELAREFGGAAAASADPMRKLTVVLENAAEKIGTALLPYIDKAANWLGKRLPGAIDKAVKWFEDDLVPAIKDTAEWLRENVDLVKTIGKVLVSAFITSKIVGGVRSVGRALGFVNNKLLLIPGGAKDASKALGAQGVAGAAGTLGGKLKTVLTRAGLMGAAFYALSHPEKILSGIDTVGEAFRGLAGLITGNEEAARNAGEAIRTNLENIFGKETTADMLEFSDSAKEMLNEVTRVVNQRRVVTLKGDIKDLDRKIKQGEKEIKDVPKSKRTDFKADIEDLKRKREQAQEEINKLRGKTVTVKLKAPSFVQNLISGKTNLLPLGPGSAAGGRIPGSASNVDNHLRPMATGEFVVRANKVNARTLPVLDMINKKGIPPQGLAGGGLVTRANYLGSPGLPAIGAYAGLIQGAINRIAGAIEKKASSFAGGAGSALGFAKAQVGKPYVWGGVGPHGYDCSGFMSAILNVMQGRSPHTRRGTTASFPWSGFSPGMGSFAIGSTKNAGGGIGHMAGSLFGVPVESRGGVGPIVGSGALSATSGMFGGPWHMQKFDRGGQLRPGVTMAVNKTGGNESVFPGGPRDFGEAVADALVRKMKANGLVLVAVDSGQRANLLGRAG